MYSPVLGRRYYKMNDKNNYKKSTPERRVVPFSGTSEKRAIISCRQTTFFGETYTHVKSFSISRCIIVTNYCLLLTIFFVERTAPCGDSSNTRVLWFLYTRPGMQRVHHVKYRYLSNKNCWKKKKKWYLLPSYYFEQ